MVFRPRKAVLAFMPRSQGITLMVAAIQSVALPVSQLRLLRSSNGTVVA